MPTPQDSEAAPVAGIEIDKVEEQLLSEIGSVDSAYVQKRVIEAFLEEQLLSEIGSVDLAYVQKRVIEAFLR